MFEKEAPQSEAGSLLSCKVDRSVLASAILSAINYGTQVRVK